MSKTIDYSLLDIPEITSMMFHPQRAWSPVPYYGQDLMVEVEPDVSISCRFYGYDKSMPTGLFFHGNGEIACQFDPVSEYYRRSGANFFVADFRGYGLSGGVPSFQNMIHDSSKIYKYCVTMLKTNGFNNEVIVKGRSLGCYSAVEVAANFQDDLRGLIIESGSAAVERMLIRRGFIVDEPRVRDLIMLHVWKINSIKIPLLTICGEVDEIIPVESILELHDSIGSSHKEFELIPMAGHNDLWLLGRDQYFEAVKKFIDNTNGSS